MRYTRPPANHARHLHQSKSIDDWSADGRFLVYTVRDPVTAGDLCVAPLSPSAAPFALLKTRFDERGAALSPDGRWMAYFANDSGRQEIYVRPFTAAWPSNAAEDASARRWLVSTAGGIHPVWRRDGKEIFYLNPSGAVMAAPIRFSNDGLEPGTPVELFSSRIVGGGLDNGGFRQYDVGPDGRFVMNVLPDTASASIALIQNWNPGK